MEVVEQIAEMMYDSHGTNPAKGGIILPRNAI
jgi:hypothetical protein